MSQKNNKPATQEGANEQPLDLQQQIDLLKQHLKEADNAAADASKQKNEALAELQNALDKISQLEDAQALLLQSPEALPFKAKAPDASIPADVFKVNDEEYSMALAKIKIKGIGERTALEIITDDTEYPALGGKTIKQHLVDSNSISVKKV